MVKKRTLALCALFVVLFIFAIALIAVGANVHQQLVPHFNMQETQCTPTSVKIVHCNATNEWLTVWNDNLIESVYARQATEALARAKMDNYALNQQYPCMCNAAEHVALDEDCNVWRGACYFNVESTRAVLWTRKIYKYGSDACLSVGSLIFLSMVLVAAIVLYRGRKANDFVVMTQE